MQPHAEGKIVQCLSGDVFDVVIDLRRDSPTFLKWHGEVLSSSRREGFVIPKGFAHGFQSLTDDVELLYLHSSEFRPEAQSGINPMDSSLNIAWPIPAVNMSSRDASLPKLATPFIGIEV